MEIRSHQCLPIYMKLLAILHCAFAIAPAKVCDRNFFVGKTLNDKYRIESMIGKGSFSMVFKASYNNTEYAVKCLTKTNDSQNDEYAIVKDLNHPNIVKVEDGFMDYNHFFIVTELLDMNLDQMYKRYKYRPMQIMLQLVNALVYLHDEKKVYHRDLKPDNILIKRQGSNFIAKLSDFGLSTREPTSNGNRIGTPMYLSPEIYNSISGIPWSSNDVWALGCVFLELLTKRDGWANPNYASYFLTSYKEGYGFGTELMEFFNSIFAPYQTRPTAKELWKLVTKLSPTLSAF